MELGLLAWQWEIPSGFLSKSRPSPQHRSKSYIMLSLVSYMEGALHWKHENRFFWTESLPVTSANLKCYLECTFFVGFSRFSIFAWMKYLTLLSLYFSTYTHVLSEADIRRQHCNPLYSACLTLAFQFDTIYHHANDVIRLMKCLSSLKTNK